MVNRYFENTENTTLTTPNKYILSFGYGEILHITLVTLDLFIFVYHKLQYELPNKITNDIKYKVIPVQKNCITFFEDIFISLMIFSLFVYLMKIFIANYEF